MHFSSETNHVHLKCLIHVQEVYIHVYDDICYSFLFIKLNISIFIYSEPIILMKKKKSIPVSDKRNTGVVEIISVTSLFMEEDFRPHEDQHGDIA